MLLIFLYYSAEAVYPAGLPKQTFLFCTINKNMKSQRTAKLEECCLVYLVCATRANIRHFNDLLQTSSNHCGLLTPDKYLPWRFLYGETEVNSAASVPID